MKLDKWQEKVLKTKGNICLCSGRQVGKSTIISQKAGESALESKKTMPSFKRTCLELFEKRCEKLGIPFRVYHQDNIASIGNHSKVVMVSMANPIEYEKVKSLTDVDYIWIEEANEILESGYEELLRRLRGGSADYEQIITTFNPISMAFWGYEHFFVKNIGNAHKIHTMVEDNPFMDDEKGQRYKQGLKDLENRNKNLYRVYYLGEFGQLEEAIYTNCEIVEVIPKCSQIFYGLDFGFNNPTALLEVGERDQVYYENELIYESGLTNRALINKLDELEIDKQAPIYCDNAEPARIQEIWESGYNALPAEKKVKDGIDYCKDLNIKMHNNSVNLIKENQGYSWSKDKEGNVLDEPVKFKDHLMDARRYAYYTHRKRVLKNVKTAITVKDYAVNWEV